MLFFIKNLILIQFILKTKLQKIMEPSLESQSIFVNGAKLHSLQSLRPSKSIAEIKMRLDNDIQKFITRESVDIYIPKHVMQRLDWDKLMQNKVRKFKINLPNRYEVTLRVYSNGDVMMYNYRAQKSRKRQPKSVPQEGNN